MPTKENNKIPNWLILIGALIIACLIFVGVANRKYITREYQLTSTYDDLNKQIMLIEEALTEKWFSQADTIILKQILSELRRDLEEVDKELTIVKKGKATKLLEARVKKERRKRAREEMQSKLQF
jgi:hypothetical protein